LASHVIFTTYGFWLPNDPRGSWSEFVGTWELFKFGAATKTNTRRSVAGKQHDVAIRRAAKAALQRQPVKFDGRQARAIGRGFSIACRDAGHRFRACSILPEHVHAVVDRHEREAHRIVGHLKAAATRQLRAEKLHPFDDGGERVPTFWAENCWKVFLNDGDAIIRAIDYVNANPAKEGLAPQTWSFVI
ncbi:MAG: transposase, partial [Phycisphaerae bacterium]|nr:transposase [Phycisphaerae bacterium]